MEKEGADVQISRARLLLSLMSMGIVAMSTATGGALILAGIYIASRWRYAEARGAR